MFPLLVALGSSNGPTPPASVLPIEDGTAETIFTKTTFIWLEILGFFLLFFYNKNFSWTSRVARANTNLAPFSFSSAVVSNEL